MSTSLFQFEGISGGFGSSLIVQKIESVVAPGEVLCILGRNGVGKSTLLKILAGHLPCYSGTIHFQGHNITQWSPTERRKMGLTYCPQERLVFDNLSVMDNLCLMREDNSLDEFDSYFEAFPILKNRLNQQAGTLSGGERKILSFVRGLSEKGNLLLLDEPSEGVQYENIEKMQTFIEHAKQGDIGFIIVEQHLAFAENIADQYLVLDQGRTVLAAKSQEVDREQLLHHLQV